MPASIATKHKIAKHVQSDGTVSDDKYVYRGIRIERNDFQRGYSSHWRAKTGTLIAGNVERFEHKTRAGLMAQLDAHFDAKASLAT